jgi:hypothetical protein
MEAAVEACVALRRNSPDCELEIRVGGMAESFTPGTSPAMFADLYGSLLESGLDIDPEWYEVMDFFYADESGNPVRTRVEYDTEQMELTSTHTFKRSRKRVVVGTNEYACRIAVATETPTSALPSVCIPTHVRIKQRRSFRDVRDGAVVWSYDLSRTWSGASRIAVEHKKATCEPTLEVECELVDAAGTYFAAHDDNFIARSLILKSSMLLGVDEVHLRQNQT